MKKVRRLNSDFEKEFKADLTKMFNNSLEKGIKKYSLKKVGLHLGKLLKDLDHDVVQKVVPRAIRKHTSEKIGRELFLLAKKNPKFIQELRKVGVSIANSLRPLAGNGFTSMISIILKPQLEPLGMDCVTRGSIKIELSKAFIVKGINKQENLKPDIDIVVYRIRDKKILAVLSCKTTLAERLMQTIRWKESIKRIPKKYRNVKVFLITAWETFENTTQRVRSHELDGAYSCNINVKEDIIIKKFDKLVPDLKRLSKLP